MRPDGALLRWAGSWSDVPGMHLPAQLLRLFTPGFHVVSLGLDGWPVFGPEGSASTEARPFRQWHLRASKEDLHFARTARLLVAA
jgi:hypothetical protein